MKERRQSFIGGMLVGWGIASVLVALAFYSESSLWIVAYSIASGLLLAYIWLSD